MELSVAVQLIKEGVSTSDVPQTWADIGAGTGLFTRALSGLLSPGSNLIAIDRDHGALDSIQLSRKDIHLRKSVLDFVTMPLELPPMDGVLLANALHFSPNKIELLKSIGLTLKSSGRIILIEYDTDAANQWVPYPVSLKSLATLAAAAGFQSVKKISETSSVYGRAMIYSALIA
jgi:ubiquinone/menaquinone biosynthesis C-methylase UbiE